jgi:hypothetical protein
MRRALIASAALVALAGLPAASADALTKTKTRVERRGTFVFNECGETYTHSVSLPHRAFDEVPVEPLKGTKLYDAYDNLIGRVTRVTFDDQGWANHRQANWTAKAIGKPCTNPEQDLCEGRHGEGDNEGCSAATDGVYETDFMTFRVRYKWRVPLYLTSDCRKPHRKPSYLDMCGDGSFNVKRLRWRRWDRDVAKGYGTAEINDCEPSCAEGHFHDYRIIVRAKKPRYCNESDQYEYSRLRFEFPRERPDGAQREFGFDWSWICGGV